MHNLALHNALVPHTLNYQVPDPNCPVNVVHSEPMQSDHPTALVLNHTSFGQAVAMLLGAVR